MTLNGTLSADQIHFLTIEYLVFLTPSVIGSFSVLLVSIIRWKNLNEQVHLLVQLALADLLASVILMYTSAINAVKNDNSVAICQYSLPLSLTFYFISFLLVVVYAWKSKSAIQGWRARLPEDEGGQNRTTVSMPVYVLVWCIPFAVYLGYVLTPFITVSDLIPSDDITVGAPYHDSIEYCNSCILFLHIWKDSCSDPEKIHDISVRVFLFIIVIGVMLSCSIIYYNVVKWYERNEQRGLFPVEGDGHSRRRCKTVISTARNMIMVVLVCWAPVLILILLSILLVKTNVEQHSLFGFYVIQVASVSLHGFLNSMVYAWRRPNFTEAVLGESTPLVAYNRMAFFDESLKCSS
ncbi:uncharacterized protein V6R79_014968 [Siganus canaliculatus]